MNDDSDSDIEFMGSSFRVRGGGHIQGARRAPFTASADVIEIFSDDEENRRQAGPAVQRRLAERPHNPLFLSDSEDAGNEKRVAPPVPSTEGVQERIDRYVVKVLDIIPDVDLAYVTGLVQKGEGDVVGQVVNLLLENPDYPKVQNKGKGKRKKDDERVEGCPGASKAVKIDYASKDRRRMGGPSYHELAIVNHSNKLKRCFAS